MFGHRHRFDGEHGCYGRHGRHGFEEMFAARGRPFSREFGRGGPGGGRGFGDDGEGRVGRFLVQGDLRLLVLALIEKEPRHGYDIIKHIEELTYGFYAPSPGIIYPTLTYLDEAGYVVAEADGNKKRYAITDEGRRYLDSNRGLAGTILERLSQLAERIRQRQEGRKEHGGDHSPALPPSIDAAMLNLREVIGRKLGANEKKAGEIVKLLLQIAEDMERPAT